MGKYLELMAGAGVEVYIIIGIVVIAFVVIAVRALRKPRHKVVESKISSGQEEEGVEETNQKKSESLLGTGGFKSMCFRKVGSINVLDFTTTTKPIGEAYDFETSCPFSGTGYIVQEGNSQIEDYDPRKVDFKFMESPQVAWIARHWPIVKDVFAVPLSMWRSPSTYFAIMMIVAVFVWGLVVFD